MLFTKMLFMMATTTILMVYGMNEGDGTFYGGGGAGAQGACMLQPGFNGVGLTVAVAPDAFRGGQACGQCIKVWGEGNGLGMTPIYGPFFATIDNLCPECKPGDVDMGLNGDGRWRIHWDYISCDEARNANRQRRSLRRRDQSLTDGIFDTPVADKCKCGPNGCFAVNGDDCVRPGGVGSLVAEAPAPVLEVKCKCGPSGCFAVNGDSCVQPGGISGGH